MACLAVHRDGRAGQHDRPRRGPCRRQAAAGQAAVRPGPGVHRTRRHRGHRATPRAGPPRCPERGHRPGLRRPCAGPRISGPAGAADRIRACLTDAPSWLQDVERDLARHPRPQLPGRRTGPRRPALARRRDPLLDVLDHVHRRRPPKPPHQGPRQRVAVLDGPLRHRVGDDHAHRVPQIQHHRLLPLVVGVVDHGDVDRLHRLARAERQRPRARLVVLLARPAALCAAVERLQSTVAVSTGARSSVTRKASGPVPSSTVRRRPIPPAATPPLGRCRVSSPSPPTACPAGSRRPAAAAP